MLAGRVLPSLSVCVTAATLLACTQESDPSPATTPSAQTVAPDETTSQVPTTFPCNSGLA